MGNIKNSKATHYFCMLKIFKGCGEKTYGGESSKAVGILSMVEPFKKDSAHRGNPTNPPQLPRMK